MGYSLLALLSLLCHCHYAFGQQDDMNHISTNSTTFAVGGSYSIIWSGLRGESFFIYLVDNSTESSEPILATQSPIYVGTTSCSYTGCGGSLGSCHGSKTNGNATWIPSPDLVGDNKYLQLWWDVMPTLLDCAPPTANPQLSALSSSFNITIPNEASQEEKNPVIFATISMGGGQSGISTPEAISSTSSTTSAISSSIPSSSTISAISSSLSSSSFTTSPLSMASSGKITSGIPLLPTTADSSTAASTTAVLSTGTGTLTAVSSAGAPLAIVTQQSSSISKTHLKAAPIVGIAIAAAAAIMITAIVVVLFRRRRRSPDKSEHLQRSWDDGAPRGSPELLAGGMGHRADGTRQMESYDVPFYAKPEHSRSDLSRFDDEGTVFRGPQSNESAAVGSHSQRYMDDPPAGKGDVGPRAISRADERAPTPAQYNKVIGAFGTESPEELERLAEEERILDREIAERELLRQQGNR